MVLIPAGEFSMGSSAGDGDQDEAPRHRVSLGAFCMHRTEVTVAQYRACAERSACSPLPTTVNLGDEASSASEGAYWSQFCNGARSDRETHPVNCVDWTQASTFCSASGGRLPTEAEWEYAARGGDERVYPWGREAPDQHRTNACGAECRRLGASANRQWVALYEADDQWEVTAPTGSFARGASSFGVLDLAGDVWEWTADWMGPYAETRQENPTGPAEGTLRVRRGGGWNSDQNGLLRAANRSARPMSMRTANTGFRCVVPR
jgi:formylglycine-generating enzyme required for sulfatase activity